MKTIRHILTLLVVTLLLCLPHDAWGQFTKNAKTPSYQFQSTSNMTATGSVYSSAATEEDGVFSKTVSTGQKRTLGVRRNFGDGDDEDENPTQGEPGDRPEPWDDPIGDGVWVMIVAAAVYIMKKTTKKAKIFAHSKYM